MTELLTASDVATIIGWGIGSYGMGFISGRLMLAFKKTLESL